MSPVPETEFSSLTSYINGYIRPDNTKAWTAILGSLAYEMLAILLIHLNLGVLGWTVHTLNIVRLFIQFHDMAHFSFFPSIRTNKLLGHLIGVYTFFPFDMWRDGHNHHHKHFGNLDRVDLSQTILFTKEQYQAMPPLKKVLVRIFRQPVIFFFFTIQAIWLVGIFFNCVRRYGWLSISVAEKVLGAIIYFWVFGLLGLPVWKMYFSLYFAQAIGTILFHLQHSVNAPYRERKDNWNPTTAALEGSTFLEVPMILRPFTNGIEYHHIHHLNTNVASYVIPDCHDKFEQGQVQGKAGQKGQGGQSWDQFGINRVGLGLAFKSMANVMLDEENKKVVPFSYSSLWQ